MFLWENERIEDCQNDEKPQEGHNIHAFAFFFGGGF